jgi:hypothetical protein
METEGSIRFGAATWQRLVKTYKALYLLLYNYVLNLKIREVIWLPLVESYKSSVNIISVVSNTSQYIVYWYNSLKSARKIKCCR